MNASSARVRVPRAAWEAVERARLTVVPRRASNARRAPFAVLVGLLLSGGVVGLLMFNTHMQQVSFQATALQQRADALTAKQQSLSMQLAHLRDPQVLAERARKLGMVVPPEPAFIRLTDGKVVGDPVRATSGDVVRISPFPARKPPALNPRPHIIRVTADSATTRNQKAGNTATASTAAGRGAGMKKTDTSTAGSGATP